MVVGQSTVVSERLVFVEEGENQCVPLALFIFVNQPDIFCYLLVYPKVLRKQTSCLVEKNILSISNYCSSLGNVIARSHLLEQLRVSLHTKALNLLTVAFTTKI